MNPHRSTETASWSSHEEEQRLSTATKDSGIQSNGDSHEELSPPRYNKPRGPNFRNYVAQSDSDSATGISKLYRVASQPILLEGSLAAHTTKG